MQVRNFFFLILICFLGSIVDANAQRVIENENGDRIIVYSDGSWKYFDENDPLDQDLLKRLTEAESKPAPAPAPPTVANVKKKKNKKPKTAAPAMAGVAPRIQKIRKVSQQKVSQAEYLEKQLSNNRDKIKKQLTVAINSDNVSESNVKSLQTNLAISTSKLKKAKKARKNLVKYAKMADGLNMKKGKSQAESILLLEGALGIKPGSVAATSVRTTPPSASAIPNNSPTSVPSTPAPGSTVVTAQQPVQNVTTESTLYNTPSSTPTTVPSETEPFVDYTRAKPSTRLVKYNANEDTYLNPTTTKVNLAHDGVDEFTGKKIRSVEDGLFYTHTSENLRGVLKGRDYLTCSGHVSSQTGGIKILNLKFEIASDLAQQEFGVIDKGSLLTVKLLDGSAIRLINKKTDIGVIDPVNKSTVYHGQYIITNKDEKALLKSEIDKVRVVWSTGYEDYDIYEMDFLKKQLNCINSKK